MKSKLELEGSAIWTKGAVYTSRMDEIEAEHPFARVTMDGASFVGGRLPVRSLEELGRYQELVLRSAEQAWLNANPEASLPADFADDFELVLTEVVPGSAISVLERPATKYDEYFELGRDELERELYVALQPDAPVQDLPLLQFPEFAALGSSLDPSESLFLSRNSTSNLSKIGVTREISETVLAPLAKKYDETVNPKIDKPQRYTDTTWIIGRLIAINAERSNYTINSTKYGYVNGRYKESEILTDLKAVLDSSEKAPLVRLFADLRFAGDDLDRILDIHKVQLLEIDGQPWSRRFIELAELEEGWHDEDPNSLPIAFSALDGARAILTSIQEAGLPLPGLFPMEDGSVNVEWASSTQVISIEIDEDSEFSVYSTSRDSREVVDFTTTNLDQVKKFVAGVTL